MIEIRNLELGPYESESTTTVGQEKNESFAFGIDKDNPDVRFINDSFGVRKVDTKKSPTLVCMNYENVILLRRGGCESLKYSGIK